MWGPIGPQTKIHYLHLLKWNRLFVFTLHIILDIIYLTYHMNENHKSATPAPLSNFSVIYAKKKISIWAKWARYSIPHNFLNICDRKSIFVSLPMFSRSRKSVLTFILQLKKLFFLIGCNGINLEGSDWTPTHIWLYGCHSCIGIGEHYLKWNHNRYPDKVKKTQNCDADGFCAAPGNDRPGSNWPHTVLWGLRVKTNVQSCHERDDDSIRTEHQMFQSAGVRKQRLFSNKSLLFVL